jgi:hypothetical protein
VDSGKCAISLNDVQIRSQTKEELWENEMAVLVG